MSYSLSIDAGTTFTSAATWRDGRATTVTLGARSDAVPSVLFLRDDDVMLVGEAAERRAAGDPTRVAREFKRRLGDDVGYRLGDRSFSAADLTGTLVHWVLDQVSEREGEAPAHTVLTCPASWGSFRRDELVRAAGRAGLARVGLLDEPTAAAAYYATLRRVDAGALVAVYDFGGGTFDAAVLRKTGDGFERCGEPGGDDEVGGVDFDVALLRHVAAVAGVDLASIDLEDPDVRAAVAELRAACVAAKEALSSDVVADVHVVLPGTDRRVRVTRAELEDLEDVREPVRRTVECLARTLDGAGVRPAELDGVLLVGGSSRIPLVARTIAAELGAPTLVDVHPKHAVCLGGAVGVGGRTRAPAAARASRNPDVGPRDAPPVPEPVEPADAAVARRMFAQLPAEPPGSLDVDLARTGLVAPLDVVTDAPRPRVATTWRVTDRDEPVVARLDAAAPAVARRQWVPAAALLVGIGVLVVVLSVLGGR